VPDVFVQCRMLSFNAGCFRSMPDVFIECRIFFMEWRMLLLSGRCFR
jgi:hypothetical protein